MRIRLRLGAQSRCRSNGVRRLIRSILSFAFTTTTLRVRHSLQLTTSPPSTLESPLINCTHTFSTNRRSLPPHWPLMSRQNSTASWLRMWEKISTHTCITRLFSPHASGGSAAACSGDMSTVVPVFIQKLWPRHPLQHWR